MKAVITDYAFETVDLEQNALARAGHELQARRKSNRDELIALTRDADVVITQFAPLTADVIGEMRRARAIVRYGIGVDNVALDAAKQSGIPVCNVPDYCIDEVADHTLSFILALTRGVVANSNFITNGQWGLAWPIGSMKALNGLTAGVIGFGRIGREVARRLLAFKSRVLVYDPLVASGEISRLGCISAGLDEILGASDVLTLHCPSTPETRGIIGRAALAKIRRGIMLVNVGRGDLVDPDALIEAIQNGAVGAAALDVWSPEPIPKGHPLLDMKNVVLSAHIASVSPSAVEKLRNGAVNAGIAALRGELPPNVVNRVTVPRTIH